MTTTATNNFDKTIKSLKVTGTLHAEKLKVSGGWKKFVPTIGNGAVFGTGPNLLSNEWRYMIENNTLHVKGELFKAATTVGQAAGTGIYTFTLPTGCTGRSAHNDAVNPSTAIGSVLIVGATKTGIGSVVYTPATNTVYAYVLSDSVAATQWGSGSDAEWKMDCAGALSVGFSYRIELLETSPILSGVNP